jgi:hypothetical protein
MKRIFILFFSACSFCLLFITCERKISSIDNNVSFDSIQINETYHLFNDTAKPACNLQILFAFPNTSSDEQSLKTLQTIFTEKMYGNFFSALTPQKATNDYTTQYIETFEQYENSVTKEDSIEGEGEDEYKDETGFSYYTRLKNTVLFNKNGFISFTVNSLVYEGGAHSSQSIYGYVINLQTGQLLQEEDFAGINFNRNVAKLLAQKIAENNGLEDPVDLENIGYNSVEDIVPNNNFTIDEKGITYYFNENEIAGTMLGLIPVFIPYEEINIYMKKEGPISFISR